MEKILKERHILNPSMFLELVVLLLCYVLDACSAEERHRDLTYSRRLHTFKEDFPWLAEGENVDSYEDWAFLSRHRRSTNETSGSKSIWAKIEEFYSDKNNMAMFCVLPIMILVYGGCSAIYCVYKCRQYMRRRKHKRLKEEDRESLNSEKTDLGQESEDVNAERDRPVSQISQAWTDLQVEPGKQKWSGQTEGISLGSSSPLPWQVSNMAPTAAAAAHAFTNHCESSSGSRANYLDDKLRNSDICLEEGREHQGTRGRKHGTREAGQDRIDENQLSRRPAATIKALDPQRFGETRAHVNLADYATNRSSAAKATDFSRFSDSRPIEIIPLTADPNLRVWDPLHNRPFGDRHRTRELGQQQGPSGTRPQSVQEMKEDILARYDALSTLQMAKKAAEILSTNAIERSPFDRNLTKKKHIFIAE